MAKPIIALNIDVTKIDKTLLFIGAKGKYMDCTLMEGDQIDQFGNAGFITQSVSKEARARGEKGPIIGNFKHIELRQKVNLTPPKGRPNVTPKPTADPDLDMPPDDVPFLVPIIAGLSALFSLGC